MEWQQIASGGPDLDMALDFDAADAYMIRITTSIRDLPTWITGPIELAVGLLNPGLAVHAFVGGDTLWIELRRR